MAVATEREGIETLTLIEIVGERRRIHAGWDRSEELGNKRGEAGHKLAEEMAQAENELGHCVLVAIAEGRVEPVPAARAVLGKEALL